MSQVKYLDLAGLTAYDRKLKDWFKSGVVDIADEAIRELFVIPVKGPVDNEIWFKANRTMTESNITSAYTNANVIGLKYEDDWYKIVYDDSITYINWVNDENTRLLGSKMTEIYLPNSVVSIQWGAFHGCFSLTSIVIPDSVTSIGSEAFRRCTALTSITIPNNVTKFEDNVFYSCTSLNSIVIPNNVTSIGRFAFYECSSLTSIVIPNNVTSIGERAFAYCTHLTSITFEGTMEEWNSIEKGYYWNSNTPATVVQCTDGDITL